jgi:hypothetical protein
MVPLTMLFGFLAGITALFWLKLALPFVGMVWVCLTYLIEMVQMLASIPLASVSVKFTWWMVLVYYLILVGVLIYRRYGKNHEATA